MNFNNFNFNNSPQNLQMNIQNQNNFNNNFQSRFSLDENNISNLNINQMMGNFNMGPSNISFCPQNRIFNIKETKFSIYLENIKQNCTIKIPRAFDKKIKIVDSESELMELNPQKTSQADAIIGIFDLNDNKYLGFVTSSMIVANIFDANFYIIKSIDLIKITNNNESKSDENFIKNLKNLFLSGNFYYSDKYDISVSYVYGNKNQISSNYLINYSLIKIFIDDNVPEFFYSCLIFGYVGCAQNINLNENINFSIDLIIIERYFNKNIIVNKEIPGYIKQIELICVFKNNNNKNLDKKISYVCYSSSEQFSKISKFHPLKSILVEELNLYNNIQCIINNVNKVEENMNIDNVMNKFNKNLLNNKISLIDYISDYNQNLYFNLKYKDFYSNDPNSNIQKNVFWFLDLNNKFSNDNMSYNSIIRAFWYAIQEALNFMGLKINIGIYEENKNNIMNIKYNEMMNKYQNDLFDNKIPLLHNANKDKYQEIIDKFFCYTNLYRQNTNKAYNNSYNNKVNNENDDFKKINILCTTWNIGGTSCQTSDITALFKKNIFYNDNKSPDIVVVAMQEIVKLNFTNIVLNSNQEIVAQWTQNIISNLQKVFPKDLYSPLKVLNLVGIYLIILLKEDLKKNVFLLEHNITKTGMYGTMGNKGFFTVTLQIFDKILSIASGHFEAGQGKNKERIDTLIQILNKNINIQEDEYISFKEADYWIILGDLNFRIELSYEDAISCIQEKNYDVLYGMDQFNSSCQENALLNKYMNEKKINFDPTYKYEKDSNEYAFDEDKIRVPAWTDRIFFCKKKGIKILTYDSIPSLRYSDHRPVTGAFEVLCLGTKDKSGKNNKINSKNNSKHHIYKSKSDDLIDFEHNINKEFLENFNKNINKDNKQGINQFRKSCDNLNFGINNINMNNSNNINNNINLIGNNNLINFNNNQPMNNFKQNSNNNGQNMNINNNNNFNNQNMFMNNNNFNNQNMFTSNNNNFNNQISNNNFNNQMSNNNFNNQMSNNNFNNQMSNNNFNNQMSNNNFNNNNFNGQNLNNQSNIINNNLNNNFNFMNNNNFLNQNNNNINNNNNFNNQSNFRNV